MIITISRQCGSGGHTIGKMLADRLGYDFYDKDIIKAVSVQSGLSEKTVEREGEYSTTSLLYNIAVNGISPYNVSSKDHMLIRDLVNSYQVDFIKKAAEKGNCIIIGRSADYILRDRTDCINIFVHGDLDDRAKRVVDEHEVEEADAVQHVLERDKKRSKYYRHVTDQVWGMAENYDLCLNTSTIGIEQCVEIISSVVR